MIVQRCYLVSSQGQASTEVKHLQVWKCENDGLLFNLCCHSLLFADRILHDHHFISKGYQHHCVQRMDGDHSYLAGCFSSAHHSACDHAYLSYLFIPSLVYDVHYYPSKGNTGISDVF